MCSTHVHSPFLCIEDLEIYIFLERSRQGDAYVFWINRKSLVFAIDEYREGSSPLYIRAVLYVERESQKAIVIGAGGQQIKKLGRAARIKIEKFVGEPVYLDLWVKVLANWRKKRGAVTRLGYGDPSSPHST